MAMSSASIRLPLELQQQVFAYLDVRSFYAARRVCKYWQFAATDAVPLAKQLRKMPILPPVDVADSHPAELQDLFDEAGRNLMLGVTPERAFDQAGSLSRASQMGFPINPRIAATSNGSKTVTLNGRMIALFDTAGETPTCIAQRPLNDLKEACGSGPWLNVQPNSYNELALSSDGRLLAISQERTIQIYDLRADPESFTVNEYISSASGHYICGIDFEQDDYVLRVRLSSKGTIVYLGTPPGPEKEGAKATLLHWKSKAGLKHVFLDSSLLAISPSSSTTDQLARVTGLQLLHPFEDGYLFAGQRHSGGESSHYILGHVKSPVPRATPSLRPASEKVTVLAKLESFLSTADSVREARSEGGRSLWENMPSAHEHHPSFAMTSNGDFLALAERDKKRIRPAPLTQLFVYRLPTEQQLRDSLAQQAKEGERRASDLSAVLDGSERCTGESKRVPEPARPQSKYTVPRIPLCLSTIQGDVTNLYFRSEDATTCSLSASTTETTRTWLLQEF